MCPPHNFAFYRLASFHLASFLCISPQLTRLACARYPVHTTQMGAAGAAGTAAKVQYAQTDKLTSPPVSMYAFEYMYACRQTGRHASTLSVSTSSASQQTGEVMYCGSMKCTRQTTKTAEKHALPATYHLRGGYRARAALLPQLLATCPLDPAPVAPNADANAARPLR